MSGQARREFLTIVAHDGGNMAVCREGCGTSAAVIPRQPDQKTYATLIAQALNVFEESGLSPAQLADRLAVSEGQIRELEARVLLIPELAGALQEIFALDRRDDGAKVSHVGCRAASREWQRACLAAYDRARAALAKAQP